MFESSLYVSFQCVCMLLSKCPAPLPLWPQRSCVNTHPPTHPLTSECVSERKKKMECLYITVLKKRGEGGGLLRNLEEKKKKKRDGEGERDRYGGRLRGQICKKVEWDIWKREKVTGTRRKLQLPNNDSLGKILFYISFSSLSSSNLST